MGGDRGGCPGHQRNFRIFRRGGLPVALLSFSDSGKGKVRPRTGHVGPEGEYRYSSTLSLTSALNGRVDG